MSRLAREFSWHLFALALVVAGLSVLAPVTWWQAELPLSSHSTARARRGEHTLGRSTRFSISDSAELEPQVAPIGPLIADQVNINLDPSINETPALPAARHNFSDETMLNDATGNLRLSATLVRPPRRELPEPEAIEVLRQPLDPPSASPFAIPEPAFPPSHAFANPTALIQQLRALAETTPIAAAWADQVLGSVERLVAAPALTTPTVADELQTLRILAEEAKTIAKSVNDDPSRSRILRAGYAVVRRLIIWDIVHTAAGGEGFTAAPIVNINAWNSSLAKVDTMLQATGAAAHWRKYLLIDRAKLDFDSSSATPIDQRQLARDMLHRLHSSQLSHEQEQFLKSPPFAALDEQLQARAAETPDLAALLRSIEQFEAADNSATARQLASEYDRLRWSPNTGIHELADAVNVYYRNANVRVALSSHLVNRMIPSQTPQLEAVEDTILGAWVSGHSHTNTKIKVVLTPDDRTWNIGLEAAGEVASDTASSKGPATFYQRGWSMFRARKRLTVDRRGIRLSSTEAEANASTDLDDFETDFDGIPLISGLIRSIARNQYDSAQPAAKVEVEGKIVGRATSQLDNEVAQQLEKTKQDFEVKIVKPLRDLNLEPTAVDLQTTHERLIARYRVAARQDVSAHTPRPQAPSDSMLSVQIHESAMNNILEQLHLHGRRAELTELHREMTARFTPTKKIEVPEDLPEDVYVTFADDDPVRVDCQDGRVRLTIRLKELQQEGTRNRWTNFTVRAYYAPSADQLDANLYRDGIIELIGDRRPLPIGQRAALTAIFARVLSRNRKLHVINKQIAEAPQLRDQQVTQFVIHDGWMGIALGPKSPGRQAAMHPRPDLQRE